MAELASYWDDIKYGFQVTFKHFFTFFLANLLILSIAVVYLLIMLLWPLIPQILSGADINQVIQTYADSSSTNLFVALNILRTVMASLFLAIGPMFGISKDLHDTDTVRFRSILTWIRRKGLKFTSAGLVQVLIIVGPLVTLGVLVPHLQETSIGLSSVLYYGALFLWLYLSIGFLNFMMPAMAHGLGTIRSLIVSIKKTRDQFKRSFIVWTIYFILLIIYIAPMAIWGILFGTPDPTQPSHFVIGIILPIWATLGSFILVFLTLPAWTLSMTRIFMSATQASTLKN